jgi:membrane protease YdiL (CAAX protease family)
VWAFIAITVALSVGLLLLLPGLGGPLVAVFIPTATAVGIIRVTSGRGSARRLLFSAKAWRATCKWLFISLGAALSLRLGVSLAGQVMVAGYRWGPSLPSPLLLALLLFAAGEEVGWRGLALPVLLARGQRPLAASLFYLDVPAAPWTALAASHNSATVTTHSCQRTRKAPGGGRLGPAGRHQT